MRGSPRSRHAGSRCSGSERRRIDGKGIVHVDDCGRWCSDGRHRGSRNRESRRLYECCMTDACARAHGVLESLGMRRSHRNMRIRARACSPATRCKGTECVTRLSRAQDCSRAGRVRLCSDIQAEASWSGCRRKGVPVCRSGGPRGLVVCARAILLLELILLLLADTGKVELPV